MRSEEFSACVHGVDFLWLGACHSGSSPATAGGGAVSSSGAASPIRLDRTLKTSTRARAIVHWAFCVPFSSSRS